MRGKSGTTADSLSASQRRRWSFPWTLLLLWTASLCVVVGAVAFVLRPEILMGLLILLIYLAWAAAAVLGELLL